MKKLFVVLAIGLALYVFFDNNADLIGSSATPVGTNDQQITSAYKNRQSDLQVGGSGMVIRILSDDTEGSRHQKFILKLSSGQTLR